MVIFRFRILSTIIIYYFMIKKCSYIHYLKSIQQLWELDMTRISTLQRNKFRFRYCVIMDLLVESIIFSTESGF